MGRRSSLWAMAALVVAAGLAGALWKRQSAAADATGPPNVLLITLDTTRADRLGAYGYSAARTPALDRLAADGVLFERAVSTAPTTLPAHASLMTGRNPVAHGSRNNGVPIDNGVPTLAGAFRDAGYRTAAFVSAFVLDQRFGLARGFDIYDDDLDPPTGRASDELERRGDRTVAAAATWLAAAGSGQRGDTPASGPGTAPFFLWVHLYDPHDPYEPPAPFGDGGPAARYDGEIAFMDTAVGNLLGALERHGESGNTIVAVMGDHGESLGEHGEATHGLFVYESAMHVPALLKWPARLPAGTRVAPLVRAIDLAPTLLELAGRPPLAGATGTSLMPLVRGTGEAPATAYGETYFPQLFMNWAPLRSLRDGQWKFIEAPTLELYDLAADPGEITNLAEHDPDRAGRMRRALHEQIRAETRTTTVSAGPDREALRKLAALGYVAGGSTQGVDNPLARPDPKTMIGMFNHLRGANAALDAGNVDEAARVASEALALDRGNAFAMLILGKAERARGRYRQAALQFRGYLGQVPLSGDAHHWLAICLLQTGDFDAALAEVELALAIDPRFAEALTLRGDLLAAGGRVDEGLHDLRAAVNISPDRPAAHIALGRALMRTGQPADGEAQFRYAITLAQRLETSGRAHQAALVYEQLVVEPSVPAPIRNLARAQLARVVSNK